jgi:hypothetical protein
MPSTGCCSRRPGTGPGWRTTRRSVGGRAARFGSTLWRRASRRSVGFVASLSAGSPRWPAARVPATATSADIAMPTAAITHHGFPCRARRISFRHTASRTTEAFGCAISRSRRPGSGTLPDGGSRRLPDGADVPAIPALLPARPAPALSRAIRHFWRRRRFGTSPLPAARHFETAGDFAVCAAASGAGNSVRHFGTSALLSGPSGTEVLPTFRTFETAGVAGGHDGGAEPSAAGSAGCGDVDTAVNAARSRARTSVQSSTS